MVTDWHPTPNTLRRAILYRMGLGLFLALPVSLIEEIPLDHLRAITAGLGAVIPLGLWVLYGIRVGWDLDRLARRVAVGDLIAASLVVALSGTVVGPFVFLYPLAVVASSFLLGPGASYYSAAASLTLHIGIYLLVGGTTPEVAIRGLALQGLMLVSLAALSDGLAARVYRQSVRIQHRDRDVHTLTALASEVLGRLDVGLLVIDPKGRIQLSNPHAKAMLRPAGSAQADTLVKLAPTLARYFQAWRNGKIADAGELVASAEGEENHTFAYRFTPLEESAEGSILINLYDLTEVRGRAFKERLAALGRLSANLAHELRNPLSSIQQATQLLAEQGANPHLTEIIRSETQRMDRWVETLLHSLRPPTGSPVTLLLAPVVVSTVQLLEGEAKEATIDQDVPPDLTVCIDEGPMQQIIWNLGLNALRHGCTEAGVGVSIRARAVNTHRSRIEVLDRGPGIAHSHRTKIFEPFYSTAPGGTGLGLSLVRELVEANGGSITVDNRPGGGSRFAVELPRRCAKGGMH